MGLKILALKFGFGFVLSAIFLIDFHPLLLHPLPLVAVKVPNFHGTFALIGAGNYSWSFWAIFFCGWSTDEI